MEDEDKALAERVLAASRDGETHYWTQEYAVTLAREVLRLSEKRRRFPIMDGPSIPWSLIEPHEAQAKKNHDQSLEQLAQRGGLSPFEAVCVLRDHRLGTPRDDREWQAELQAIVDADVTIQRDALRAALENVDVALNGEDGSCTVCGKDDNKHCSACTARMWLRAALDGEKSDG